MSQINRFGKFGKASSKEDIPVVPHYAAIVFRNIYHEGDERSRTNPGHGYPDHTEVVSDYISFESKKDFDEWFLKNNGKTNFVVLDVKRIDVTVKTETTFNIRER